MKKISRNGVAGATREVVASKTMNEFTLQLSQARLTCGYSWPFQLRR